MYRTNNHASTMESSGRRGRRRMMSPSGLLNPSAVAGSPSVTRLTQSSWIGESVSGMPSAAATKMHTTSPMLEETMYRMNCLVLS